MQNENKNISIFNCYFSTKVNEPVKLIKILNNKIKNTKKNIIILGEFNFIEDKIDTKNAQLFHLTKDKIEFTKLREQNHIFDIYEKIINVRKFIHIKIKKVLQE